MDRVIEHLKQQIQIFQEYHTEKNITVQIAAKDAEKTHSSRHEWSHCRPNPPAGMVKVPKGPFLYGEDRRRETIEHDYWIGRHPVTNEQFRAFILTGGYENQGYWSQKGWTWKTTNQIQFSAYWNDVNLNKPNHPVVGVSFYEAEAYAKWAGKRLPTEQEWEKAARGTDGPIYPWRDEFDENKCNSGERVEGTSPVSQYPGGVSLYGCYDMAGNVWEWCASWWGPGEGYRVLRGGS